MKAECPNCNQPIEADDQMSGMEVPCPTCQQVFRLPAAQVRQYTIVELEQGSPEWHEWRHKGVGASDAPTIMRNNPWKSIDALLLEKQSAPKSSPPNEAMSRGIQLEPEARRHYIRSTARKVQPACLQSNRYEWLRASVDGITAEGDWAVEIKCGKSTYRDTLKYAENKKIPPYYYDQLQHILAVTGLESMDFWCYLPGQPELLVRVDRNNAYIDRLLHTEFRFWTEVMKGV